MKEQHTSGEQQPAQRTHAARSLFSSLLFHLLILSLVVKLLHDASLPWLTSSGAPTTLRVAESTQPIELTEQVIEPPPEITEIDPDPEPQLVEQADLPLVPMPEDPLPPEPLDWLPPKDLFSNLPDFKRPQVTEPEVKESSEPATPELPVVPTTPHILQGTDLPQIVESPTPRYPRQALRMRWHGTVVLRARVDSEGRVMDVIVHETSGHEVLDESAVAAFQRWVFRPRREGEPEVRILQKPFTFQL